MGLDRLSQVLGLRLNHPRWATDGLLYPLWKSRSLHAFCGVGEDAGKLPHLSESHQPQQIETG
jgi:hypothetical protein